MHSIGYCFKNEIDETRSGYASHRGTDCLEWFMNELTEIAEEIHDFLSDKLPMNALTNDEEISFQQSTHCHICKKSFNHDTIRVKDHCHLTGLCRGPAHQSCNLQYQISRTIPIVFHNLSGYDSYLFIKSLSDNKQIPGEITIIRKNTIDKIRKNTLAS